MAKNKSPEQHFAVFGERGSGKTVLVSTFYGLAQEPDSDKLFDIFTKDTAQGVRLHQNYLGMKNSSVVPEGTRFSSTSYCFVVRMRENPGRRANRPFDSLQLVWHDYPGEWFTESPTGLEAERRVETFRTLLTSDVAFLLVDGQKLVDNQGEEERYLKSLFSNFCNGLLALKDDLIVDGKPFDQFPRIWVIALSKADLLPEIDVIAFRDLVIGKAGEEINRLRRVIAEFITVDAALAVGEDFVLTSAAEFTPNKIDLKKNIGLNVIMPIAATLPFLRHSKWVKAQVAPVQILEKILGLGLGTMGVGFLLSKLLANRKLAKSLGNLTVLAELPIMKERFANISELATEKVSEISRQARAKHDYLTASLADFILTLETAEEDKILLRSPR